MASYGRGRATIVARSGSGIAIFDTGGIDIEGLAITGRGKALHNVVRFNISSADVHDQNGYYGGISILGFVKNSAVYQNTDVMAPQTAGMVPALQLSRYVQGDTVRNNLFAVHGGAVIAAKAFLRPGQVELQGNDYYSALPWSVNWDGSLYSSMSAWRSATREEMLTGHPVGLAANPDLT